MTHRVTFNFIGGKEAVWTTNLSAREIVSKIKVAKAAEQGMLDLQMEDNSVLVIDVSNCSVISIRKA